VLNLSAKAFAKSAIRLGLRSSAASMKMSGKLEMAKIISCSSFSFSRLYAGFSGFLEAFLRMLQALA